MTLEFHRFKARSLIVATSLVALLGLNVSAGTSSGAARQDGTAKGFQELRQDWGEAIDTLQGYSAHQRDQAMASARKTLDAMDRQIEQLERRAEKQWGELNHETRKQRRAALASLRQQRNRLAEWYGGMKHGSTEAWEEVKDGFASAYDRLADAMAQAMEEFESEPEGQ